MIGPRGLDSELMGIMWPRPCRAASGTAKRGMRHGSTSGSDVDDPSTGGIGVLDRLVPAATAAAAGLNAPVLLTALRRTGFSRTASAGLDR